MSKKEPWGFCETPEEKCTMNYCDDSGCQNRKRVPTESYRMVIMDMSKVEPPKAPELKQFDIWVGWFHLGQGHHPPTGPEKIATVEATTFKIACWLHELERNAKHIREQMKIPNAYIEDIHFGTLYYDSKTNSNSWIGRYFETEEEALATFSEADQSAYLKKKREA
jgi:hypothetical protein